VYQDFLSAYQEELIPVIQGIPPEAFGECIQLFLQAYRQDKQVFVLGNGGSAAAANHFVCDFGKNAVQPPRRRFRILSLSDNVEKITAFANDIAFEEIFRQQLINLMNEGDLMIVISASGNSPNLVRACEYAREKQANILTLAGFDGGRIRAFADASIPIPLTAYEPIEDMHMILLHMFTCFFKAHQELLEEG
jgi:D-sedoheptulose 7-phosphate isomerase